MTDIRVADTANLLRLNAAAIQADFNRAADPEGLSATIDPDGTHVLCLVLFGHNMDTAPVLHHRVRVLAKATGSPVPRTFILDIADDEWRRLPPRT